MNCTLCQKELDAYYEGKLPDGIRIQVEAHLEGCRECTESYRLMNIANKVMDEEKGQKSNPFLSTRIIARIEALELKRESYYRLPVYQKILKPVLISVSIAAAIFIGVMAGNIYNPAPTNNQVPVEMSYMNDAAIESVNMLSNQ